MLAMAGPALGASITLERSPSPPQAIKRGAGTPELINWRITSDGPGLSYAVYIEPPVGSGPDILIRQVGSLNPADREWADNAFWIPPATAAVGRYRVRVDFYSVAVGAQTPETSALGVFDVADQLGNLRVVKYEDLNGNGVREGNEPGVPNWRFTVGSPLGGTATLVTGADGTATLTDVPVGAWSVSETLEPGWVATTPTSGTVTVTDGQTASFVAGNVRPSAISGTVWLDLNRNQVIDPGETGRSGVGLTLSGTDGLGRGVSAQALSSSDGTYLFPSLMPGTYSVTMSTPAGLEATTPTVRSGIVLVSNVPSPNNNFGLAPPAQQATTPPPAVTPQAPTTTTTTTPQTPARTTATPRRATPRAVATRRPDTAIRKTGPARAEGGDIINYRIVVRSTGRGPAVNVVVRDPIPDRMTLVSLPASARVTNGVVTWRLGTMQRGQRRVLALRLRLDPTAPVGRYTNTATVTADGVPAKSSRTTLVVEEPPPPGRSGGVTG
jgi:uncharacterized repeat protein (TIGR01451 family)